MHIHNHSHAFSSKDLKSQKVLNATYLALTVSIILSILKFGNYFLTNSVAIESSALDSLMDVGVSFANFLAIKLTLRKTSSKFPKGLDKISALVAVFQVVLVSVLSFHLIHECYEKLFHLHPLEDLGNSYIIILIALLLNTILVAYQSKVVKETNSMIIKADMLHYKTDFLTNISIIIGLFFMNNFGIYWLDPVIGFVASFYLLFSVVFLLRDSIFTLLDGNDVSEQECVFQFLKKNNFEVELSDIYVSFSGIKNFCEIKVKQNDEKMKKMLEAEYETFVFTFIAKN